VNSIPLSFDLELVSPFYIKGEEVNRVKIRRINKQGISILIVNDNKEVVPNPAVPINEQR